MSEARIELEGDDVLASIRRLVARERRPRPALFVLTPEYRVDPAPPEAIRSEQAARAFWLNDTPAPKPPHGPPPVFDQSDYTAGSERDRTPLIDDLEPKGQTSSPSAPGIHGGSLAHTGHVRDTLRSAIENQTTARVDETQSPSQSATDAVTNGHRSLPQLVDDAADSDACAECESSSLSTGQRARPEGRSAPHGEILDDTIAFIDEEDLQRIVARIVRDELRGQLGEKITALIRKLVRAEIARMLDGHDLLR